MKKTVSGAFLLGVAVAVASCGSAPRMARYNFTVEVEDNGRIARGSAIQEEHCVFSDGLIRMGNALNCGVKGEAVVVDLGEKGRLFVLLTGDPNRRRTSDSPWGLLEYMHRNLFDPVGLTAAAFDRIAASRETVTLDAIHTPMMVRFRDINDPTTVELVDPAHLEASFGPGVKFAKATTAIASNALTTGIEKTLPWLNSGYPGRRLFPASGGPLSEVPPAHLLTDDDFWSHMR
jgi:hypothetical protein